MHGENLWSSAPQPKENDDNDDDDDDVYILFYMYRFIFYEIRLRKEVRSLQCHDHIDIIDFIYGEGSVLRGSYCGSISGLEVISQSNNVTLRLTIGELSADMPKMLGFVAEYESVGKHI